VDSLRSEWRFPNDLESLERGELSTQLFEEAVWWLDRSVPPQIEDERRRRRIRCLRGL
jgi:hypothetical protein